MRFSVITATKNNKEGLIRAIECVRNQTYKDVEHIVVDGESTDGSVEILRHFDKLSAGLTQNESLLTANLPTGQAGYSLLAISEQDEGIYDAINKGIKLATGDVIGLLHSDDLYADENVIKNYASAFDQPTTNNQLQTIQAVYSDLVYVRQKSDSGPDFTSLRRGKQVRQDFVQPGRAGMTDRSTTNYSLLNTNYSIIRYWKSHKSISSNQSSVNSKNTDHYSLVTDHLLKNGWMPPHPTLFIRKEVFNRYGLYNTDLRIASDYEMILRLLFKHKITSCYLPITTYLMSIGGASNKSIGNIITKSREDYAAMKRNGIPFPLFTLLCKNFRKLPQFLARDL